MSAPAPDAPTKVAPQKKGPVVKLELSGEPRVQLLPPSVRGRAVVRSRIRTGVLLVILGALVVAIMFGYGVARAEQAQLALDQANADTNDLREQQKKYADAVKLDAQVAQLLELEREATSTEVDWASLMRQLVDAVPEGGDILSVNATGVAAWHQVPSIGASDNPRLANITMRLRTKTIQDATAFSRQLAELDGFAASLISRVTVDAEGDVTTMIELVLTSGAESGRYADDDSADETTTTEGTEG